MTLSREDGQLYYKLWLPMLDFVNRKYRINRKLKSIATAKSIPAVKANPLILKSHPSQANSVPIPDTSTDGEANPIAILVPICSADDMVFILSVVPPMYETR